MNLNISDLQQARIRRDSFLKMNHKPFMFTAKEPNDLYYIYMIESKTNPNYRYIGKTKNIYDRALNYIRNIEYRKTNKSFNRPIINALSKNGIDDFIMYPIATVNGKTNAGVIEQFLISKFHTFINEEGLNVRTDIDESGGYTHIGVAHTIDTKIKKSKPMIAISNTRKTILIAIGGKILGDLLQVSKDEIKNVVRRPCHLRDWYIYYINDCDRTEILNKYMSKNTRTINGFNLYRCDDDEYVIGAKLVERFADNPSEDIFLEDPYKEYKVIFVTYNREYNNDNPLENTYKLCPLSDFLELID